MSTSWIDELFEWADEFDVPDLIFIDRSSTDEDEYHEPSFWYGLPRDKHTLFSLEELNLSENKSPYIPEQLRHLTQ